MAIRDIYPYIFASLITRSNVIPLTQSNYKQNGCQQHSAMKLIFKREIIHPKKCCIFIEKVICPTFLKLKI